MYVRGMAATRRISSAGTDARACRTPFGRIRSLTQQLGGAFGADPRGKAGKEAARTVSSIPHVPCGIRRARLASLAIVSVAVLATAAPVSASAAVSFGATASYNTGFGPFGVAVGDFNEDSNQDVVSANGSFGTSLMLNNGSGAFSLASGWPKPAGGNAFSVVVGDYNEDGHADLATSNQSANTVTIQLGDGSGGLLSDTSPGNDVSLGGGSEPFFIAKGDFNEDDHQDLVTANQGSGDVSLLLGDGTGGFSPAPGSPFHAGALPRGLAVGDVDEDGHLDVVTANQAGDNVSVLLGDGSGGLSITGASPYPVGDAPREVTLGDFNNDHHLDFATGDSGEPGSNNKVSVYLGDGTGAFTLGTNSPFTTGNSPFAIDTGDFDGDGNLDIVTANRFAENSRDDMSVLMGNGNGGFAGPLAVPASDQGGAPTAVAVGDLNNDGKPDLVMNQAFEGIVVALNTTQVTTPTLIDSDPDSPANDNGPKLIGTAGSGATVKLYTTNDCSGSPVATDTAANFASPGIAVSVADDSDTTFYATATNHAGWGVSACSSGFTYSEDSTAPAAPTGLATNPASPAHTRTPQVSGTAADGSTVTIYTSNDCSGGSAATGSASDFDSPGLTVTVPRNATTSLSATATDAAGNTSPCSSAVSYTEAGTPVPTGLDISPRSPGRDTSPRVTGTAEAGSTVKLYTTNDCSGSPVSTGTAAEFSSPGIAVSVPSGTARTFRATATDSDGNASPCSDPVFYTQDDSGTSTYYVRQGGTGSACTQATPCGTIADALVSHRLSPTPNDVIDVGTGTFVGDVEASDPADDGLTIRGTLGTGGSRDTTIRPDAGEPDNCSNSACAVVLGASPDAAATLEGVKVDTVGGVNSMTPVEVRGGSDLTNVDVSSQPSGRASQIVALDDDPGTTIDHSTIDASGTGAYAVVAENSGLAITDSHVITGEDTYGIDNEGSPTGKLTLTRTWIESDPNDTGTYVIVSSGDVTLDSSLATGGYQGLYFFSDGDSHQLQVRNSTIDVGQPGQHDDGNAAQDLYIDFSGSATPDDVTVADSILADDIQTYSGGGPGSFTCTHSDLQGVQIDPPITDDCAVGGNGNTSTDPADQFAGGDPFSWELKAGAPAIDAGEPGAVDPSLSQTDLAGNPRRAPGTNATCPDGVVDMGAYELLGFPCSAPGIDSSSPASPANDNSPKLIGTAPANTTVKIYKNADCTGSPDATGSSDAFSSTGIAVSVTDNSSNTFTATATNSTGTSPCSSGFTYTEDSTAPNTTITAGPANGVHIKDPTPSFRFASSETGSTFRCKIDSGTYLPCSSPKTTAHLGDGTHTFSVRATDQAGNTDATPASRQFTVDTRPPQTTITSGPVSGNTRDRTPTFGFRSSEPGSSFACKVDRGAFKPCTSPATTTTLAFGNHTVGIRATDRAGNTDPTPAHAAFKVVR